MRTFLGPRRRPSSASLRTMAHAAKPVRAPNGIGACRTSRCSRRAIAAQAASRAMAAEPTPDRVTSTASARCQLATDLHSRTLPRGPGKHPRFRSTRRFDAPVGVRNANVWMSEFPTRRPLSNRQVRIKSPQVCSRMASFCAEPAEMSKWLCELRRQYLRLFAIYTFLKSLNGPLGSNLWMLLLKISQKDI
jgi:hypothetical protein